jgi:DNA-binding MarR family transcriptional regulator
VNDDEATANLLGALAMVVTDQLTELTSAAAGQSGAGPAALSALGQFLDLPTLDAVAEVLGLTHSGAVRLVDRLSEADLVERAPGIDRRSRIVSLTAAGQRAAGAVTAARGACLDELVGTLSVDDRRALQRVAGALLTTIVNRKDSGAWICRLCNLAHCGHAEGHCPTACAAAEKYGPVSESSDPSHLQRQTLRKPVVV